MSSSNNHENYRPRSPDLSAFAPPPPLPRLNRLPSYQNHENSGLPPGYPSTHRGSYDASPFFSPLTATPTTATSYFSNQSHIIPPQQHQQFSSPSSYHSHGQPRFSSISSLGQGQSGSSPPRQDPQSQHQHPPQPYSPFDDMARPKRQNAVRSYVEADDDISDSVSSTNLAPTRPAKKRKSTDPDPTPTPKTEPELNSPSAPPPITATNQVIEVRTKFPVARIKRIMQADEDVGKVAQATPTAVSKALELFIISLVTKGAAEARSKNAKKVTASHLKAALMKEPQMDFLNEICDKISDEPRGRKGKGGEQGGQHGSSDEGTGTGKGKGWKEEEWWE